MRLEGAVYSRPCEWVGFDLNRPHRRDEIHEKTAERVKKFFIELQQLGHEWIQLGVTKTGAVYRLCGNPPQCHE